jgi:ribulose-phosphate 3-epimerase
MWKNLSDRVLISASIIASDLSLMGSMAASFDPAVVDLLHVDVMDGVFVPNLTIGPGYIKALKPHTGIPLDVHLMIERPELSLDRYIEISPWCLTIHYESTRFPARLLQKIRAAGIKAGLSLNPATPVEMISDLCDFVDLVLVMSVDPGFYGQPFMESSLGRIRRLRSLIADKRSSEKVAIEVDGGVTADNIAAVVEAGARIVVTGASVFQGGDVNSRVRLLKEAASKAL